MMNNILNFLLIVLILSCNNITKVKQGSSNFTFKEINKVIEKEASTWYTKMRCNNGYTSKLTKSINILFNNPLEKQLETLNFKSLNENYGVDIFSAAYIRKILNKGTFLVAADPDVSIIINDYKNNCSQTLLSLGSLTTLHKVIWLNGHSFIVLGIEESLEKIDVYSPIIIYFDIENKQEIIYFLKLVLIDKRTKYIQTKYPLSNVK